MALAGRIRRSLGTNPPVTSARLFLPDYWGRPSQERSYYVGALTLMLAAAGLILRPRRERAVVALLGVVAVAATVGTPPVSTLLDVLPLFNISQNGRMAVVFVLCAALLAGWGLDELTGRELTRLQTRALVVLCISLAVLPVVYALVRDGVDLGGLEPALDLAWGSSGVPWDPEVTGPSRDDVIRLASLLEWLPMAAAAAALVALRLQGRLSGAALSAVAVALIVADVFKAGMGLTPAIPVSHADPPTTPAIRYLQDQRPARFAGVFPAGGYTVNPLPPNLAMSYGLYDARGHDVPIETRFDRFWTRSVSPRFCYYYLCTSAALATPQRCGRSACSGSLICCRIRGIPCSGNRGFAWPTRAATRAYMPTGRRSHARSWSTVRSCSRTTIAPSRRSPHPASTPVTSRSPMSASLNSRSVPIA